MASRKGKFITGAVGPVVFRTYRGKQIISSKARTDYHIAEGTMKNANTFGKSSTFACLIRDNLKDVITPNYDGTMPGRLVQEVVYTLTNARHPETNEFYFGPSSFAQLSGFQFNRNSLFNRSLSVEPSITVTDNMLTLHLPEFNVPKDFKFPLNATSCNINFSVMEFNLLEGTKKKALRGTTTVANTKGLSPAQEWIVPLQEGWLSVVAISLNYVQQTFAGNVVLNNKEFCPAMIIKAGFMTNINHAGPFELKTKSKRWAKKR